MKNKQDFILNIERECSLSALNRFVHRRFDRETTVWSDSAGHNILVFVLEGDAVCWRSDRSVGSPLHRKVTLWAKGEPFVAEFRPGCEILTYSFDGYLPVDTSAYDMLARGAESVAEEEVAFEMPPVLHGRLVNISENIGLIGGNDTLTHLTMRKVTGTMLRSLKPSQVAMLLSPRGSELKSEIFRYMKIAENGANLTKKPAKVIF